MYENSAEDHSIVFTLSEKKILESVKAGVSDTLSRDGQMIPIQYNKRRSESDEKAEGSVKSAFLVLITFLILRLLILIQEAHYSGWLFECHESAQTPWSEIFSDHFDKLGERAPFAKGAQRI